MEGTVDVTIPVDASVAAEFDHAAKREVAGRLLSRLLKRKREAADELETALDRFATEARANGLTDAIVEEELAAYNAERRG